MKKSLVFLFLPLFLSASKTNMVFAKIDDAKLIRLLQGATAGAVVLGASQLIKHNRALKTKERALLELLKDKDEKIRSAANLVLAQLQQQGKKKMLIDATTTLVPAGLFAWLAKGNYHIKNQGQRLKRELAGLDPSVICKTPSELDVNKLPTMQVLQEAFEYYQEAFDKLSLLEQQAAIDHMRQLKSAVEDEKKRILEIIAELPENSPHRRFAANLKSDQDFRRGQRKESRPSRSIQTPSEDDTHHKPTEMVLDQAAKELAELEDK